jgi:hypothetical protein
VVLTEHHAMKEYCGVEDSSIYSFTLTLCGGEWSANVDIIAA